VSSQGRPTAIFGNPAICDSQTGSFASPACAGYALIEMAVYHENWGPPQCRSAQTGDEKCANENVTQYCPTALAAVMSERCAIAHLGAEKTMFSWVVFSIFRLGFFAVDTGRKKRAMSSGDRCRDSCTRQRKTLSRQVSRLSHKARSAWPAHVGSRRRPAPSPRRVELIRRVAGRCGRSTRRALVVRRPQLHRMNGSV
jgi:hypothetical protein